MIKARDFLPRFVDRGNYADNFGLQWQRHAKTQLDSETGATYSRDRFFATTGWAEDLSGQRVLEAGSGAGRFTEIIVQTGASLFSFDYSDAVIANYANNGHNPNCVIFQGDIYRIPFPEKSFDKVVCMGVIQHTPEVRAAFQSLVSMVRPGGELVVDWYLKGWRQMLHWKYLMRPVTTRMDSGRLYDWVNWYAPKLMPAARLMRRVGGRAGHRFVPILDQSDKAVSSEVQRDWTILDTYDALSARYDTPQKDATVRAWFEEFGFKDIRVGDGRGRGTAAG